MSKATSLYLKLVVKYSFRSDLKKHLFLANNTRLKEILIMKNNRLL